MKGITRVVLYLSFPLSFTAFIFPIFASNIGISVMEIGILYSVFSLISILFRPLVGKFIDNKGRKRGLIIGAIFYVFVNVFFIIAKDLTYLFILRIFQSIAASFLWISVDTVISDISNKENRAENFGIINQISIRGELLGCIIAFSIIFNLSNHPFRIIYSIFLIFNLVSIWYILFSVKETKYYQKDHYVDKKSGKAIINFLVIMGLFSLISNLTAPIYLIYLKDYITKDLVLIAYLFCPGAILGMFLPKKFGVLADKLHKEYIIFIGVFFSALIQIFIPYTKDYYMFIFVYTLLSVINMFYAPAILALVTDYIGDEKRGKSYGLYNLAIGIGGIFGPLLGTIIYQYIGNKIVFYTKGILLLILLVLILLVYKKVMKNKKVKYEEINSV